jgi:hypothetical protein
MPMIINTAPNAANRVFTSPPVKAGTIPKASRSTAPTIAITNPTSKIRASISVNKSLFLQFEDKKFWLPAKQPNFHYERYYGEHGQRNIVPKNLKRQRYFLQQISSESFNKVTSNQGAKRAYKRSNKILDNPVCQSRWNTKHST